MTAPSTVIAPEALQMQLSLLRLAFPGWEVELCGFDRDRWFEAKRRVCAGDCLCMLVVGSAGRMLELLSAEDPPEDGALAPSGFFTRPFSVRRPGLAPNDTAVAGEAVPSGYIDGPETPTCESQS